MKENDVETKAKVIVVVRIVGIVKDSIAEMHLQEITCGEYCEAENYEIVDVIREVKDYPRYAYEGTWDAVLQSVKEYEDEIDFVVISRTAFQSIEEYQYLGIKLDLMGVMLLLPEEDLQAGWDEVLEILNSHYYYFKEINRETKLGLLNKMPDNIPKNDQDRPSPPDIN